MCFLTFGVQLDIDLKPIFEGYFLIVLFQLVFQFGHLALFLLDFMQNMLVFCLQHVDCFPIVFSFPLGGQFVLAQLGREFGVLILQSAFVGEDVPMRLECS